MGESGERMGESTLQTDWGETVGMGGCVYISLLWWYIKGVGGMYSGLH